MSRIIRTYTNLDKLNKNLTFKENCKYPIIVASQDLVYAIEKLYKDDVKFVMDVNEFLHKLLVDWHDEQTLFKEYLCLSKIIRSKKDMKEYDSNILLSYRRNLRDVLDSIRKLEEIGLTPNNIVSNRKDYLFFRDIWIELEKYSPELSYLQSVFQFKWAKDGSLTKSLKNIFQIDKPKKIILIGFYYISPLQERLFDLFEKHNIELIFLNHYDYRYKEVYEIWEKKYNIKSNLEEKEKHNESKCEFGELYSNGEGNFQNVNIIEYKNDIEFVDDIKRINSEKISLYGVDVSRANKILMEYYPEKFKKRHLLSYPVGQFIYYLHNMWNDNEETLVLDIGCIKHCFASGWFCVNGVNAKEYVKDLEDVELFFKDCKYIKDWEERLELLKKNRDMIKCFDEELPNKRWHKLMGNPFNNFSIYQKDFDRIQQLVIFINHLIQLAEYLFPKNEDTSIALHMDKIKNIIKNHQDKSEILDEEQIIIDELLNRVTLNKKSSLKCFPGDVADAIQLLIGGGFVSEDSEEVIKEINVGMVKPIMRAETSSILENGKIHLCFCNEDSLPGKEKSYPWPLSCEFLESLNIKDEAIKKYLDDMRFIAENNILYNRYLFSEIINNKYVELSWISHRENKTIDMSSYLRIINDKKINDSKNKDIDMFNEIIKESSLLKFSKTTFPEIKERVPNEVDGDNKLCGMRYVYGYLLNELPNYTSEFHYSFAISDLISSICMITHKNKKEVETHVFKMFPYLKDIEKKQISDFSIEKPNEILKNNNYECELDWILYPSERVLIHYLTKSVIERLNEREKPKKDKEPSKNEYGIIPDTLLCKFCPHDKYCFVYAELQERYDNTKDKNKKNNEEVYHGRRFLENSSG